MKKFLKTIGIILSVILMTTICLIGLMWYKIDRIDDEAGRKVEWSDNDGEIIRNLRYGKNERNTYDLFLPANADCNVLMLFIHGGSWMSGNKEDIEWAARRYAQEGYITATINYSRLGNDRIRRDSSHVAPSIESMITEIHQSIEAIKKKCSEQGYHLTQMAIGGYSAGGHLAMLYTARHMADAPVPIKFQISWVGPTDMVRLFYMNAEQIEQIWQNNNPENLEKRNKIRALAYSITGDSTMTEELNAAKLDSLKMNVSPLYSINHHIPPTILVYGAKDNLVHASHGEMMHDTLQAYGIDSRLYIFPNSGHELGFDENYTDSVNTTILDFCKRYFNSSRTTAITPSI